MTRNRTGNDADNSQRRAIRILVTGFEPFQQIYPVNPSFEILKLLPHVLPEPTSDGRRIETFTYNKAIRVNYDVVRDTVPRLHAAYSQQVDMVLHIGMASSRSWYSVERYAHRDGYNRSKDVDGQIVPPEDGITRFGDCPSLMTTSLDYNTLLKIWQDRMAGHDCRESVNAGHYLCDYIYFNSLAWYGRRDSVFEGGSISDRPVLFFHVPPEADEKALETGLQVTVGLLEAMAESFALSTNKASQ